MRHSRALLLSTLAAAVLALGSPASALAHCRDAMVHEINAFRVANGVPALRKARVLERSSKRYSRWMIRHDRFGHAAQITASRYFKPLGEVLSIHAGGSDGVAQTVDAWAASPGHAAVLLNGAFQYVGTGRRHGAFNGQLMTVWVVRVGAP